MHTSEIVDSVEMDRFWAEYPWLPAAKGDVSRALLHSGRNSTAVLHTKLSASTYGSDRNPAALGVMLDGCAATLSSGDRAA